MIKKYLFSAPKVLIFMAFYLGFWQNVNGRNEWGGQVETQRAETVTTDTDPALPHRSISYIHPTVWHMYREYRMPTGIIYLTACLIQCPKLFFLSECFEKDKIYLNFTHYCLFQDGYLYCKSIILRSLSSLRSKLCYYKYGLSP